MNEAQHTTALNVEQQDALKALVAQCGIHEAKSVLHDAHVSGNYAQFGLDAIKSTMEALLAQPHGPRLIQELELPKLLRPAASDYMEGLDPEKLMAFAKAILTFCFVDEEDVRLDIEINGGDLVDTVLYQASSLGLMPAVE